MPRKSPAQLDREIKSALARCPDCGRPFDPTARRHTLDPDVNRFLIPSACARDYGAANPAWKPTRHVPSGRSHSTTKASVFSPHPLTSTRTVEHEKRKDIEARFPIGSYVKGKQFAFKDQLAKVTGYDLGMDEDAPLVKIRFVTPVNMGTHVAKTAKLEDDAIKAVSKQELAGDKLLTRFRALDEKRKIASEKLHQALVESDRVTESEERIPYTERGKTAKSERRKAADRRSAKAINAERAITSKMRDLVIQIRAIDPARVPWGWQNTR